jgi:uncharacterized membrane protein YeaQ/YmgE (transglycosylase-associated protein family)
MSPLVWFILIGLTVGWIAGQFLKGGGFGIFGDIVVGMIGAVIGGFMFHVIGLSTGGGLIGNLTASTIGAVILLLVTRQFRQA